MRLLSSALAVVLAATCGGTAAPGHESVRFGPIRLQTCVDTPLRITFDHVPTIGSVGAITVHRADGSVADRIDLADPASAERTIGDAVSDTGQPHEFHYNPVLVDGDTASITLHHRLDYRQTYYVTIDPGVFTGFAGIQDPYRWRFTTKAFAPWPRSARLTVAADGAGDFCTVQGAIDAVPEGNQKPLRIDVRPGTYTEIDYVRAGRRHLTVAGSGLDRTVIQYANNDKLNGDTAIGAGTAADVCPLRVLPTPDLHNCWRSLFGVDATDFTLQDITLHNTTPYGGTQAEAFRGNGQHITLDRVVLESYQDTLRLQGTGFVTDSFVQGDVDFVWGTGSVYLRRSVFESMHAGYVTQIRNDVDHHGDVFVDDRLTRDAGVADGSVYLGRIQTPRFPYSQAVYLDTAMDKHIAGAGWLLMSGDCGQAVDLQDWEYHSTDLDGRPLDTGARLPCSRQLAADVAAQWRDPAFVLYGWVPTTVNADADAAGYRVAWSAPPGHSAADRIALCRKATLFCPAAAVVGSGSTGTLTFPTPRLPGSYEFRYLTANGQTSATSAAVAVR